jgi:hypothetical protein
MAMRPVRKFVGRPGYWVKMFGTWHRPLRVVLQRGAWQAICWVCDQPLRSGDELYGDGWPTQPAAYAAALQHCARGAEGGHPPA